MVEGFNDEKLDPHYTGYFDCFNRQLYYEAHEVLEHLWLKDKHGPDGAFYKGLIQLAGAFVHLQRNRSQPAAALFKLALANLEKYPASHRHLNLRTTAGMINQWLGDLEQANSDTVPTMMTHPPKLALEK